MRDGSVSPILDPSSPPPPSTTPSGRDLEDDSKEEEGRSSSEEKRKREDEEEDNLGIRKKAKNVQDAEANTTNSGEFSSSIKITFVVISNTLIHSPHTTRFLLPLLEFPKR